VAPISSRTPRFITAFQYNVSAQRCYHDDGRESAEAGEAGMGCAEHRCKPAGGQERGSAILYVGIGAPRRRVVRARHREVPRGC
jgi:hypothetical protein